MLDSQRNLFGTEAGAVPKRLTKGAFAQHVGYSPGRISQMIAAGLPVESDGKIDVAKGRAWIDETIRPNRTSPSQRDGAFAHSGFSPRAARDAAEAKISGLKAERLAGRLIDRKATLRMIEGRARLERDAWISWVNRTAPIIAAETSGDLATITAILDREVRANLITLAELELEVPK